MESNVANQAKSRGWILPQQELQEYAYLCSHPMSLNTHEGASALTTLRHTACGTTWVPHPLALFPELPRLIRQIYRHSWNGEPHMYQFGRMALPPPHKKAACTPLTPQHPSLPPPPAPAPPPFQVRGPSLRGDDAAAARRGDSAGLPGLPRAKMAA